MELERVNEVEHVSTKVLVNAYLKLKSFRYKTPEQRACFDAMEKELNKREKEFLMTGKVK